MDIDLFAKLLKELILDNERVTLPGLGTVESFVCPSVFTDRGYTLQPPYRQLSFSGKEEGDTLLVDRYAAVSGVAPEIAEVSVRSFTASVKESLLRKETIDIPGLGRLRSTLEGNIFIVCDEDLDIYPEGLGLSPVSLKNNRKEVRKAALETTAPEPEVETPVSEPAAETPEPTPAPVVEASVQTSESAPEPSPEAPAQTSVQEPAPILEPVPAEQARKLGRGVKAVIWTAAAAAALLLALAIAGRLAPGLVDPLLYSSEELEIINHG